MFHLTRAQMRMWYHYTLHPTDAAYTVVIALRFDCSLDRDVLQGAIETVIAHNPILRTSFQLSGEIPVANIGNAQVAPRPDIRWKQYHSEDANTLNFVQQRCDIASQDTFDLANGQPPVWFELIGRNNAVDGLVICQHHIITDGWSTRQLEDQLARLYSAALAGEVS